MGNREILLNVCYGSDVSTGFKDPDNRRKIQSTKPSKIIGGAVIMCWASLHSAQPRLKF